MKEFDITLKELKLRIICGNDDSISIQKLMNGHYSSIIENPSGKPTYTLVIEQNIIPKKYNLYIKMVDKWFDNATCDVWIDDYSKFVYMNNINASAPIWRENLVKYFTCNLFNRLIEEKGYVAFHASCVEKHNKGIVFIAPRDHGKTSCMLTLMNEGYNSITNDKLAITKINEQLFGYGVAQDVSIRLSPSFRNMPQNKKYLQFAKEQNIQLTNEKKLEGQNIHLDSVQLATLNNVKQIPEVQLNTFIFPNYDSSVTNIKLDKMSKMEIENLLLTQSLLLVHETTDFLKYATIDNDKELTKEDIIEELTYKDFYKIKQGEKSCKSLVKTLGKINDTY